MGSLLKILARTSEFWLAILGIVGSWLAKAGVIPEEQFNTLVVPLVVYIVGRITSKVAKAAVPK